MGSYGEPHSLIYFSMLRPAPTSAGALAHLGYSPSQPVRTDNASLNQASVNQQRLGGFIPLSMNAFYGPPR
jgi:hypothetical protein